KRGWGRHRSAGSIRLSYHNRKGNKMDKDQIKVLLIEDNPGDVRLIQEMLSDNRHLFRLEDVDRLSKGLEFLAETDIDVVLIDLGLPDSRGLETFKRFHNHKPTMPVVVLTGLDDEALGIKAVREGAQDYLMKGDVGKNVLTRSLRFAIERQKLLCELQDANTKIGRLEGLLPICAACKMIRDDKNDWNHIETYIRDRSDADFTHTICPTCAKELYPELYKDKKP
ncbi:MAG: response regulator, partial [Candidatus Anammoxibacter sp.]